MVYDYGGTQTNLGFSTGEGVPESQNWAFNSYGGTGDIYYMEFSGYDEVAVALINSASYNIGTNNTFCGNGLDIYAPSPSYAYAISNTYSRYPYPVYGNVFVTGVNDVCGVQKSAIAERVNQPNSIDSKLFKDADEKYLTLLRKIREDTKNDKYDKNKYVSDFTNLIEDYKNIVNVEKEKLIVKAALSKLNHLYRANDNKNSFIDYLKQLSNNKKYEEFLPYINRYFI